MHLPCAPPCRSQGSVTGGVLSPDEEAALRDTSVHGGSVHSAASGAGGGGTSFTCRAVRLPKVGDLGVGAEGAAPRRPPSTSSSDSEGKHDV